MSRRTNLFCYSYLGRSVGYGSLSLWTHNLKEMEIIQHYSSKAYSGPADKFGAGVQVLEGYQFVDKYGYMMVGGECGSVGVTGGYTAGGGQSPLSSYLGLAADQALEYEVILADGRFVRANAEELSDLYWALSGGGPGYGVVWSVTYKAHPDVPISGAQMTFKRGNNTEGYWQAIETWHSLTPSIIDRRGYTYGSVGADSFTLVPLFLPNGTKSDVEDLLSPLFKKLDELSIPYLSNITVHPTFLAGWSNLLSQGPAGEIPHLTSYLLPRETFENDGLSKVTKLAREITSSGGAVTGMALAPNLQVSGHPNNAVNPGWRDANMFFLAAIRNPNITEAVKSSLVTDAWGGKLRALSPGLGTYMNEADSFEPNFQTSFFGSHYSRLLSIRQKYDPTSLFYARNGVGSEAWEVRTDGHLCKV